MLLTESVRSFQVPATPWTWACPPSLPSVPTSRATRVTSLAKEPSWSTIVLTVWPMRRNSPLSGIPSCSSGMRCERSPLATAPMTRATSSVGWTRSPMRVLIESIRAAHAPVAAPRLERCVIRPSLPTTVATRAVSRVSFSSKSARSLNASTIAAPTTVSSTDRRTLKSPFFRVFSAASSPFASKWPLEVTRSDAPSPAALADGFLAMRSSSGSRKRRRSASLLVPDASVFDVVGTTFERSGFSDVTETNTGHIFVQVGGCWVGHPYDPSSGCAHVFRPLAGP